MKKLLPSVLILFAAISVHAQRSGTIVIDDAVRPHFRKEIRIPDIPGYMILKCDFHMHTVWSDGTVWPTIRVSEAWEDGLDAIAITDHIEDHPKKLPGQKHLSYETAFQAAKEAGIILIKGGEISRSMPPGHFNALFIKDVNALDLPDYMDALGEAVRQGGFIIWNHPGWRKQQPDTTEWMAEHEAVWKKGWMHGIEVFNEKEWYPEAIQWAMEKNLAITGNSDIHGVYNDYYNTGKYPVRPLTLVFAKEKNEASVKEALFARRSATLFFNKLVGKKEFIGPLVSSSITVKPVHLSQKDYKWFAVKNSSDIEFTFVRKGTDSSELPGRFILPARGEIILKAEISGSEPAVFTWYLENVITGVEQHHEYRMVVR